MERKHTARISAQALPDRHAWLGRARDRTAGLRARLLTGDPEAAQITDSAFHLLYWQHRGQQIFPLRDAQRKPGRGDR